MTHSSVSVHDVLAFGKKHRPQDVEPQPQTGLLFSTQMVPQSFWLLVHVGGPAEPPVPEFPGSSTSSMSDPLPQATATSPSNEAARTERSQPDRSQEDVRREGISSVATENPTPRIVSR